MDESRREALQQQLEAMDAAGAPFRSYLRDIEKMTLPHRSALASIASARSALLEGIGVEIAGACQDCNKLLFAGELGSKPFDDERGITYCESCAPTWADRKASLPADPAHDEEEQAELRALINELEADGRLGEKAGLATLDADPELN